MNDRSKQTILGELEDLWQQAVTENSHYYVASVAEKAITEIRSLQEKNSKLKTELWVAKDSQLRTYDGLAIKADQRDDILIAAKRLAASIDLVLRRNDLSDFVSSGLYSELSSGLYDWEQFLESIK